MSSLSNNRFDQAGKIFGTLSRLEVTKEEKDTNQNENKIALIMSKPNCQRTQDENEIIDS